MEFTAATRTVGRVRGAGLSETATKYDYNMMKAGRCDFSNRNVLDVSEVTDSGCGTKMKYSKYNFQVGSSNQWDLILILDSAEI